MPIRKMLSSIVAVGLLAGSAFAGAPKAKAKAQVLKQGHYTAQVKAIVCGACAPKILETVRGFPGIEDASVDQDNSQLNFSVKSGAKVSLSKLQGKLKAASEKMGMGADYTLREIKEKSSAAKNGTSAVP